MGACRVARSDYHVARLESRISRLQLDALWERITREVADALTDLEAAAGGVETSEQARRSDAGQNRAAADRGADGRKASAAE